MLKRDSCDWIEGMIGACTIMISTTNEKESILERHIYSRGLGRGMNMGLQNPYKQITSECFCIRHRWYGLVFRHDDRIISSKVLAILISSDMGCRR